MRDQIARDARPGFEDPASLRPEGEPVGIDRLWLGKSAVNRIGNRRDRGQIGRAHRPPLAAHGWPRNGATTAAVTRSGRPDRKSGGWGKSVSLRVDLGGCGAL